jgi:hypothetical protein
MLIDGVMRIMAGAVAPRIDLYRRLVMPGLVPGIHVFFLGQGCPGYRRRRPRLHKDVDARD